MATAESELLDEVMEKCRTDWPWYARHFLKIVDKRGKLVDFEPNAAQLALDAELEKQRLAGMPQRAVVVKARQVGISTGVQGKLIQRTTLNANHSAIVVAHDLDTGAKLYQMGRTMYRHLPLDDELPLKPEIGHHKRARHMNFSERATDAWQHGDSGLNSEYLVSTAGETEAGRGGTYRSFHGSEVAFWQAIAAKLMALLSGMPDDEDTLVVLESTPNGLNEFKDIWDDAVEGKSDFIAFFWPWWKQAEYTLPFANKAEREDFAHEVGEGPLGEDEPRMIDPGPLDTMSGEQVPLTLEQLHWRRKTIANKLGGRVDRFKQEFPTTPEEAFLSTGQRVFDPFLVQSLIADVERTDPRMPTPETPGPAKGRFKAKSRKRRESKRTGLIEVPEDPLWVPRSKLEVGEAAGWKLWIKDEPRDKKTKALTDEYVIACDPSGGQLNETDEPDRHAVQICNHETKQQVASYASRVDPDLLAEEIYLAALFFNRAWVAIEITGGFGLPVARRLWLDYRYGRMYVRRSHDRQREKQEDRLGWSTDRQTKPIIVAGLSEELREGTHGIRDRDTAMEMQTYVRNDRGQTGAESGKYDDRIEAYMILKQVARELPIRLNKGGRKNTYGPPSQGYDNRPR